LGKEQPNDLLSHPTPSLFERPETHRAAISQLEGLPYEGLPGFFPFPVSVRRLFLFHNQIAYVGTDGHSRVNCDFYERLRSPGELIAAMELYSALSDRDIPFGRRPQPTVAITIFPSMFDAPEGVVPLPEAGEPSIGDHLVLTIGLAHGHLYFLNNWGPKWGVQGVGCFSVDYLSRFQREAWSVRSLTGPDPAGFEGGLGPSEERRGKLFTGAWDEKESIGFFPLHHGAVVDVLGRWLIGISDGSMWLQCVAVLHEPDALPLIVGWMHVRGTADGAEVEELFVWPRYRERGIGTALAGQTLLYAAGTSLQHSGWRWHELEADSIMLQRSGWNIRIPGWLKHLTSNPENVMTSRAQFLALLERLAESRSLDGVRLLRENPGADPADVEYVVDDDRRPTYGVIVNVHR
jgi:hypothetical protein